MPIQKNCTVCGKEFTVANARAETAKTCSQACRGVLIAKAYEAQRVRRECQQCGDELSVSVGRAERGNGVFCGRVCKDRSLIGKRFTDLVDDGEEIHLATGYVYERSRNHPFAVRGRVFQHRLVVESMMAAVPGHHFLIEIEGKQYLKPGIDVHHKNEIRNDNRPENLIACTKAAHKDLHAGKLTMTGEVWPEQTKEIAASARNVRKTCANCGCGFMVRLSHSNRGAGKFCSKACFRAEHEKCGLPPKVDRECEICGAVFQARRWHVVSGRGRFCSNPCRIKFLATTHHTKDTT